MMEWLSQSWGTIVVCLILAVVVAAIVIKLAKDKKAGKSSCGGNCEHCGGACHACKTSVHKG